MKTLYRIHVYAISLVLFFFIIGCSTPAEDQLLSPGEGSLAVDGGEIWYKVSGDGDGIPLVFLHGVPGFSSFYLKPLEELSA